MIQKSKNNLTFDVLILSIEHDLNKSSAVQSENASRIGPFQNYCAYSKFEDTRNILECLKTALLNYAVTEISTQLLALKKNVICRGIGHLDPTITSHEVQMFGNTNLVRFGLLFVNSNDNVIMRAVAAIIIKLFGFEQRSELYLVNNLMKSDIVICDSHYDRMLKAASIPHKKCIVLDIDQGMNASNDCYISLPMTADGFQTLYSELNC